MRKQRDDLSVSQQVLHRCLQDLMTIIFPYGIIVVLLALSFGCAPLAAEIGAGVPLGAASVAMVGVAAWTGALFAREKGLVLLLLFLFGTTGLFISGVISLEKNNQLINFAIGSGIGVLVCCLITWVGYHYLQVTRPKNGKTSRFGSRARHHDPYW